MAIVSKKLNHLLWSLLLLLIFLGCQSSERTNASHIVKACDVPKPYEPIDIDPDASHIIVDVQIGDRKYPFILDTGCTGTMFDERLRGKLGKSIGHGILQNTGQQMPVFRSIDAYIGGINIRDENPIACMDFSRVSKAMKCDILGFIGMSSMKRHRIVIDKANGTVQFLKSSSPVSRSWGKGWNIHYRKRYPYIYIDEIGEDFLLDTGLSGSGRLTKGAFKKAMLREGLTPRKSGSITLAGHIPEREIRVIKMRLLGREYHGIRLHESQKECVLGLELLARHIVLLDFPRDRMYLKKGKRYHWQDRMNSTGMVLGFFGNEIKVLQVLSNRTAERLGIRKGDVIEDINGMKYDDLTMGSIDRIFEKEKYGVKINLIRDGQGKTVVFTRKKSKR